jgi:hypothetical protein
MIHGKWLSNRKLRIIAIISAVGLLVFAYAYVNTLVSLKYECEDGIYNSSVLVSDHCNSLREQAFIFSLLACIAIGVLLSSSIILILRTFRR